MRRSHTDAEIAKNLAAAANAETDVRMLLVTAEEIAVLLLAGVTSGIPSTAAAIAALVAERWAEREARLLERLLGLEIGCGALRASEAKLHAEGVCDSCLGKGSVGGHPCGCRGSGRMVDMVTSLREALAEQAAMLTRLRTWKSKMLTHVERLADAIEAVATTYGRIQLGPKHVALRAATLKVRRLLAEKGGAR